MADDRDEKETRAWLDGLAKKHREKRAAKKVRVVEKVADPEVYRTRLAYQGVKSLAYRPFQWVRIHGKWQRMDVRNRVHSATATVHEGSIKALTTESVPDDPSLSWFHQVDKNVLLDRVRKEKRENAAAAAMTKEAVKGEQEAIRLSIRFGAVEDEGPFDRFGGREDVDPRVVVARREEAAETLEETRQKAGVDPATFELLRQHLAFGVSLRELEGRAGVKKSQISRRLGQAIDRITAETRRSAGDLVDQFKRASQKETE